MENEVLDKSTAEELVHTICEKDAEVGEAAMRLWNGRGWIELGYSSWDALCDDRFKNTFCRIPRSERDDLVRSMRAQSMSHKAISAAIGLSTKTLQRMERGGHMSTPERVTGTDGKTYTRQERLEPSAATHEATAQQEANTADFRQLMNTRGESPEQKHAREHKFYDDLHKVTRLLADLSARASDEPSLPDNISYFIESARQSLDNITAVKDGVTITDDQIMAELLGGNNA